MEPNVDTSTVDTGTPPPDSGSFDRGADRSEDRTAERRSVRDELRAQFDEARIREGEPEGDRPVPGQAERRSGTQGEQQERQRQDQAQQQTQDQGQQQTQQQTQTQPPAGWAKEAKDVWAQVPAQAQAAIVKREQDIQNGVNQLREHYSEIDEAISPFYNEIRQFNKTPGQAVAQLFAWFDALQKNPDAAFPALLRSYGYDPRRLTAAFGLNQNFQQDPKIQQQQKQQQQIAANQQKFQNYIANLVQQQAQQYVAPIQQQFQEQQAAKTYEMLDYWSKDKPYFEHVRVMMGQLLTPDPQTGMSVIPLKDGKVDLDGAYEAACRMHPEINQQLWNTELERRETERKAAEQKKIQDQKAQAEKARRAGNSLTSSAPGAAAARNQPQAKGKGKSVRDSLNEAIAEYGR